MNPGAGKSPAPVAGFELLLQRLAGERPEAGVAGVEFERLRRTLTKFFDWRGAADPDACADTTLDRLARKLAEGTEVRDLFAFARGIARLVLHEAARARRHEPLERAESVADPDAVVHDAPSEGGDLAAAVERCLGTLGPGGRELVLAYYAEEGRRKIEGRQRLAQRLELTANALRSRVQRLRDRLEACVRARATHPSR